MKKIKGIALIVGISAALAAVIACNNGSGSSPVDASGASTEATVTGETAAPDLAGGEGQLEPADAVSSFEPVFETESGTAVVAVAPGSGPSRPSTSLLIQPAGSQAGIWVTGQATVSLEPDVALLNIGVEATGESVAEARGEAAVAMEAITAVLDALGVEERDIQTQFFNISPRYEFREVLEGGIRTHNQVLVGYMVSNSSRVKIRDLQAVGTIVDAVADAGGDAIRINGIRFTVDDPRPFMDSLREDAVNDALAKAQQFADLTGVSLGRLVFIAETGGGLPVVRDFASQQAFAALESVSVAVASPISAGELELRMTVQTVFDIE